MAQRLVVQTAANDYSVANSGSVAITFGAGPTNGNLMIAVCTLYDGNGAPSAATGWNLLAGSVHNVTGVAYCAVFYRYAGASEPAAQTIEANGRQLWTAICWEISGVTGVIATDVVATHLSALAGGTAAAAPTTGTVSGFTTANANELLLGAFSVWSGTANAVITTTPLAPTFTSKATASGTFSGVFSTLAAVNGGDYGQIASSGTTVNGTFTVVNSSFALQYGIIELASASASSTETGAVAMHLSGVSFNVAASFVKVTVGVSLHLSGVRYNAQVQRTETAAVTMRLNGVTIAAAVIDLGAAGSGAVHFSTFGA